MLEDQFKEIAGQKPTAGLKACRVMKFDLKQFLKEKYDIRLRKQFLALFDFAIPAYDYNRFCDKFDSLINFNRQDLHQLVFNFFDLDGDGKISERDMHGILKYLGGQLDDQADKLTTDFIIIQTDL